MLKDDILNENFDIKDASNGWTKWITIEHLCCKKKWKRIDWNGKWMVCMSRLMSKMGWTGGGLGKDGEGRVEPVSARLYPQGKSLDWCMERR